MLWACLVMAFVAPAKAGIILTLDNPSITGAPGQIFTLTGSITHADPSEDLVSLQSFSFTSSVLQLLTIHPGSAPYPGGYTGNILTVQILANASPGSYAANPFSLTFDSINGRTFSTNPVNLSVTVEAVPEPGTLLLTLACLLCFGVVLAARAKSAV